MSADQNLGAVATTRRFRRDGKGWTVVESLTIDGRPWVAIDPESREQVERLWRAWRDLAPDHRLAQDNLQAALREFANPRDPKPDEPQGLGAVVEDAEGRRWVRWYADDEPWLGYHVRRNESARRAYSNIAAVKVLAPGWSE